MKKLTGIVASVRIAHAMMNLRNGGLDPITPGSSLRKAKKGRRGDTVLGSASYSPIWVKREAA